MTAVNAVLVALLGVVFGFGAVTFRWVQSLRQGVSDAETSARALQARVVERTRVAAARERLESAQRTAEGVVDTGNETVRTTHTAISDVPFAILDQIPSTREGASVVKGVHDAVTNGVYDAISLVNRLAGEGIRRGINGARRPDTSSGTSPDDGGAPSDDA